MANYWWKHAYVVDVAIFLAICDSPEYPSWFMITQGKTTLIPKPGEFRSENQQPITCLKTIYKWFTACLFAPINYHLQRNNLMESQQRGAKSRCTTDNFLIERMVIQDCARGNLYCLWNTKIVAKTKNGLEMSEKIQFERGLPQADALCARLFTLCFSSVAWMLN